MGFEVDLLQRAAFGWNMHVAAFLQRHGVATSLVERLQEVLMPLELVLLVLGLAAVAARVDRWWREREPGTAWAWALGIFHVGAGLYAARLLYWVYRHPSSEPQ